MAAIRPDAQAVPSSNEVAARSVLARFDLEPTVLRPLHWKPGQITPLYYLETATGRFVLKQPTPRGGVRVRPLREHLLRQEIAHQAHVLEQLGSHNFRHLRVPKLIATDYRSFMVLEFIETEPRGEFDLPRHELLGSLLEFQTTEIELERSLITDVGRDPGVLLARRLLTSLRSRLGWRVAGRAFQVALDCYRSQPRLPRPILRHNDFHHNNLLLATTHELYVSDFEYVAYDSRWALGDIIHFAVGTGKYGIDVDLILDYASRLREALGFDFALEAQLRFNLLLRVGQQMLTRSAPPEVSARYEQFFTDVLIDDERFRRWLEQFEGQPVAA
jgi:hypothetical protein